MFVQLPKVSVSSPFPLLLLLLLLQQTFYLEPDTKQFLELHSFWPNAQLNNWDMYRAWKTQVMLPTYYLKMQTREYFKTCGTAEKNYKGKGKGKAIPLQTWTGPEGSRRLGFSDFKTIRT